MRIGRSARRLDRLAAIRLITRPAPGLEEVRGKLVPEPARAGVHAHTDGVLVAGEQVDVMDAGADRAELVLRRALQPRRPRGAATRRARAREDSTRLLFFCSMPNEAVEEVFHELADPRARVDVADHLHRNTPYSTGFSVLFRGRPDIRETSIPIAPRAPPAFDPRPGLPTRPDSTFPGPTSRRAFARTGKERHPCACIPG